ncbi:MAG TPA: 23S rRNA (uracil(747)-C(5))-methyltransferase RlmC [Cellulomonas sp.]
MFCPAYDDGRCRSCTLLAVPYDEQLAGKAAHVQKLLAPFGDIAWQQPAASAPSGYRNKAKLVVGGTVDAPTLGILDADHRGVDLQDCLLYDERLAGAFPALSQFVTDASLEPYAVPERSGELKHLLVTVSPDGELMLRLVLRSTEALARIRKHLPSLQAELPSVAVVSVNVLPAHAALLEGEREILLTEASALRMRLNGLDLWLRPQGFFQTNSAVAAELYRQAAAWLSDEPPESLWDLYCGVGGFALHAAAPGRRVLGVETSEEAVTGARASAAFAGIDAEFVTGDATAFAVDSSSADVPDVVVVNPPRRGIGGALAGWLEASGVPRVLYSSCHAESLATDLAAMPSLRPVRARLLDMFPQTAHDEVLVELRRTA